jgi:AraC-like DNA-binding protein
MKAFTFIPSQPEIEYKTDYYIKRKPLGLNLNIALYYQFKTKKESNTSFSIIPDGTFDLLFCCCPNNPSSFLWTSPYQSEQMDFQGGCEYFGVRFFPEQNILNLNCSMRELLGKKNSLSDLMSIDLNIEQLLIGNSFSERIRLIEKFIESITPEFSYQNIVGHSINQIYLTKGNISIKQLATDTGYSDRYLRKKFEEAIGFSPKQFSDIVRFQNSLAMIFMKDNYNTFDIVYENGYHDHAHFIKGFKKFSRLTPNQFAENFPSICKLFEDT